MLNSAKFDFILPGNLAMGTLSLYTLNQVLHTGYRSGIAGFL